MGSVGSGWRHPTVWTSALERSTAVRSCFSPRKLMLSSPSVNKTISERPPSSERATAVYTASNAAVAPAGSSWSSARRTAALSAVAGASQVISSEKPTSAT